MNEKILINASNLHSGGGVQVATSFISELVNNDSSYNYSLLLSSKVKGNLDSINCPLDSFLSVEVLDIYGLQGILPKFKKYFTGYSKVFTIFGPNYSFFYSRYNIVGFAQPWIIYPDNPVFNRMASIDKLKTKLKYAFQGFFFLRSDELIVELEHVKSRLEFFFKRPPVIHVVYNCCSSVFDDKNLWSDIKSLSTNSSNAFKIGYLSRDYPHKNIDILSGVRKHLREFYNVEVDFYVTLSDFEWENKSNEFKSELNNVGEINVSQCPVFIESMDAMIFPSYLECFSAMPLETLRLNKPLFASDLPFVSDVCGEYAIYFDPSSIEDISKKIHDYLKVRNNLFNIDKSFFSKFSAASRANSYIEILNKD
ncbi:glycosyltransferase [Marinomonas communis]|uniref:Glycosyltransferase involved in cell wall biosynthesis n=1 Tax=Marinomonas communis TaxID=28254 RepID=A0A4R6X5F2_9GAMM|nr:glycosyltransferase [Marinomonas communis]TDR13079.1 glycosyltransferase involved in cell wall biosynthesis [Marinomonas communis]